MILHASGPVHTGHVWHVSTCFYCMAIEREKVEMVTDFLFLGSNITADGDCSREIRRCHSSCDEKPRQSIETQRHYSADKGLQSQGYGPPSGHVQLWELDHKEGGAPKNWYLWTLVLEKTPESPLDSKKIKPVNLKGDQPWILVGRTDAKVEAPIFWSSDVNRQLTGKVPDAGKDWGRRRGCQRMRWLDGVADATDTNLGRLQEKMRDREAWSTAGHAVTKHGTWLGYWKTTTQLCTDLSRKFCYLTLLPFSN